MCVSGPSIEAKRYTHMKSLSSKQRYKEIHISVATDPSTVIKSMHMPCCSVAKLCLTLCDPMNCSTPGFPFLHCLREFAQTHVH